MKTRIEICKISGLCYGAQRALDLTIDQTKKRNNIVLFKQLLHNKYTVDKLLSLGVSQKDKLEDITNKDFVILRAHGEEKSTYNYLESHQIDFLDCTCPNVLNIIKLVHNKNTEGYKIIIIGKYGKESGKIHPEVKAVASYCDAPILIEDVNDINKIIHEFNEVPVAEWIQNKLHKDVEYLPNISEVDDVKLGDYKVDKKEIWELKTIKGNGKRTLDSAVKDKKDQASIFILDLSYSKMEDIEAIKQSIEIFRRRDWVDRIILKRDKNILKVFNKKRN